MCIGLFFVFLNHVFVRILDKQARISDLNPLCDFAVAASY